MVNELRQLALKIDPSAGCADDIAFMLLYGFRAAMAPCAHHPTSCPCRMVIVGAFLAFLVACGIGANDVANSFATSEYLFSFGL